MATCLRDTGWVCSTVASRQGAQVTWVVVNQPTKSLNSQAKSNTCSSTHSSSTVPVRYALAGAGNPQSISGLISVVN